MAHVWTGADPAELDDVDDYELGSRFRIDEAVTITGARIWSPGERSRSSRNAKLWVTASDWTGQSQVTQVALPDTLAAGWSEHTFDTPVQVTVVPAYYVISFDTATAPAANSDYGAVSGGLAADHDSADGKVAIVTAGGRFNETPDSYPTSVFGTPFYGVDMLYSTGSTVSGTAAAALTSTRTATGTRTVLGAAAASLGGLTATVAATRTVVSTAAAALASTRTVAATRTVTGTAASSPAFTATAAGTRTVLGVGVATSTLTATVTGVRTVVGSTAATLTSARTVAGTRTGSGTAAAVLSFAGTIAGRPSQTVTGTALAAVTLTATIAGIRTAALVQGSWYGLLAILRELRQERAVELARRPVGCPQCGEPLVTARGRLRCPFDGWSPR